MSYRCHRYIGKVTKFGLFKIIIFRSYCHFSVGGAKNAPCTGVGLSSLNEADWLINAPQWKWFDTASRQTDCNTEILTWHIIALTKFHSSCMTTYITWQKILQIFINKKNNRVIYTYWICRSGKGDGNGYCFFSPIWFWHYLDLPNE